jgi:hypothetical protein
MTWLITDPAWHQAYATATCETVKDAFVEGKRLDRHINDYPDRHNYSINHCQSNGQSINLSVDRSAKQPANQQMNQQG